MLMSLLDKSSAAGAPAHSSSVCGDAGQSSGFQESASSAHAELMRAHLASIVDSSDDAIVSKDLSGTITSWNKGAERVFGYSAAEVIGKHITIVIPYDRLEEEPAILEKLKKGERVDHFETIRRRKDGSLVNISLTISPVKNSQGEIIGASKIARDISERKRIERELNEYREHLEQLVEARSAELAATHNRLRSSERLSAIGTLSAGLGHDIGNVMMPLNAHISVVENSLAGSSEDLREHFQAIHQSVEYLQSLANGLRLLAIDPDDDLREVNGVTNLSAWWGEAEPLLRTALTKRFRLEHDLPDDLPPAAIPPHALTQAVFNLVQNAAQALSGMKFESSDFIGRVRIAARQSSDRKSLLITVSDNGPGMTAEVKAHCVEPFFTTKTRGISTGLGLAVVHGIVQNANGTLDIDSVPGNGSTFTMIVPVAKRLEVNPDEAKRKAIVDVSDPRLRALLSHELALLNYEVSASSSRIADDAVLLVIDGAPERRAAAAEFVQRNQDAQALIIGTACNGQPLSSRMVEVGPNVKLEAVRQVLRNIACSTGTMQQR
jgi:PAS domain S-box-containing protein